MRNAAGAPGLYVQSSWSGVTWTRTTPVRSWAPSGRAPARASETATRRQEREKEGGRIEAPFVRRRALGGRGIIPVLSVGGAMARKLGVVLMIVYAAAGPASVRGAGPSVQVVPKEAERRVDVLVDGQPFTSYIWPTSVKKPVLYPIRTDRGAVVTRGFPLEPRPREHTDHPPHVGLWLNYGDVNGVDFWGTSGQPRADGQR